VALYEAREMPNWIGHGVGINIIVEYLNNCFTMINLLQEVLNLKN
jgi:hypothetical protein